MEYIYSAMLLHSAGKEISEEAITQVFVHVPTVAIDDLGQRIEIGVEVSEDMVKRVTIGKLGKVDYVKPQDRSFVSFGRKGTPTAPGDLSRLVPGRVGKEGTDDTIQMSALHVGGPGDPVKMSQFPDKLIEFSARVPSQRIHPVSGCHAGRCRRRLIRLHNREL